MESLPNEIVNKIKYYNSHPCADIIKQSFRDDGMCECMPKFITLGYWAFIPLIKRGTNGRQIENDYDEYWKPYQYYFL